jgi:hypothetical protein
MRSDRRRYKHDQQQFSSHTRVETGSNTSTATLRVVGGDEKGSLKSESVKYSHEFQARTRERLSCRVPAAYTEDATVFLSERLQMGPDTKTN